MRASVPSPPPAFFPAFNLAPRERLGWGTTATRAKPPPNPRAEELYGYSAAEAIGKKATLVVPPELRDAYEDLLRRVGGGEVLRHHVTQRLQRGGKILDISLTATPIRNAAGEVVALSWIGEDITQAKRYEEALQATEERNALLLDSVTDHAIFLMDPRGRIKSWNTAAEHMKKWKEEDPDR